MLKGCSQRSRQLQLYYLTSRAVALEAHVQVFFRAGNCRVHWHLLTTSLGPVITQQYPLRQTVCEKEHASHILIGINGSDLSVWLWAATRGRLLRLAKPPLWPLYHWAKMSVAFVWRPYAFTEEINQYCRKPSPVCYRMRVASNRSWDPTHMACARILFLTH